MSLESLVSALEITLGVVVFDFGCVGTFPFEGVPRVDGVLIQGVDAASLASVTRAARVEAGFEFVFSSGDLSLRTGVLGA